MKTIQMFFDILYKYQQLKYKLKCEYENYKLQCKIKYVKHYKKTFLNIIENF
jgi:hypothetical protein